MIEVEIKIRANLDEAEKKQVEIEIGAPHSGVAFPVYSGPTTVIPEAYEMQILQTEKKSVMENIVVFPIPYFQTSNPQGGNTVYIGE